MKVESPLCSPSRTLLFAAACVALATACSDSKPGALPPNLLLITVDTLRADHLGPWGDTLVDTPAIDGFAADAYVFDEAFTAIPITTPSLGSMLTGVLPRHHGALNNTDDLSMELETLPMALAELGYKTAAFLPTFLADKPGFKRGFATYDFPALGQPSRPGGEVVARAMNWLGEQEGEQPWFVWVHLVDPHAPYDPGPVLEAKYLPNHKGAIPARLRGEVFLDGVAPPPKELEIIRALYRGDVELTDQALAPLLSFAREGDLQSVSPGSGQGPANGRELITLFTADHGEMLGEKHGYVGHTGYLDEEMLRVPFLVHFSSGAYAGNRSYFPAYALDVAPTLLTLAGGSGALSGSSYEGGLPLFDPSVIGAIGGSHQEIQSSRFLVHETFAPEGFFDQSAARSAPFKIVLGVEGERPGGLYFLDADPGELVDQTHAKESWTPMEEVRVQMLARSVRDWHKLHDPIKRPDGSEVDEVFRAALEGMGYFGSGIPAPDSE